MNQLTVSKLTDRQQWIEEETNYIKGETPFANVASRQQLEPDLPPSAIPGDIWFKSPLYGFGDVLLFVESDRPYSGCLDGVVMGMQWDEYDWEYSLMGGMAFPFEAKEHELIKYNPDLVRELLVYRHDGMWVFDAPEHGLEKEPFVCGADTIIDRLTVLIDDAQDGFILRFSPEPFPRYRCALVWESEGDGGNWYHCPNFNMKGWLCPALFHYFDSAPAVLYVQAVKQEVQLLPQ